MGMNDLYWLGAIVVIVLFVDIILGNIRAGYEGINNSSAGIKGILKKSMILVLILSMTGLLAIADMFIETNSIIVMITGSYTAIVSALGYYEAQSALANIQLVYPDLQLLEIANKFFNVDSEKENKERKLSVVKSEIGNMGK